MKEYNTFGPIKTKNAIEIEKEDVNLAIGQSSHNTFKIIYDSFVDRRKFTQEAVAISCGCATTTLSRYLTGSKPPEFHFLIRLVATLNLDSHHARCFLNKCGYYIDGDFDVLKDYRIIIDELHGASAEKKNAILLKHGKGIHSIC